MKTSFLKSAVALVTCGLVAFGAAQVKQTGRINDPIPNDLPAGSIASLSGGG